MNRRSWRSTVLGCCILISVTVSICKSPEKINDPLMQATWMGQIATALSLVGLDETKSGEK
jgi:hypothetical protein